TSGAVPKANSARLAAPSESGSSNGPLCSGTVFKFVAAQSLKNCAAWADDKGDSTRQQPTANAPTVFPGECTHPYSMTEVRIGKEQAVAGCHTEGAGAKSSQRRETQWA